MQEKNNEIVKEEGMMQHAVRTRERHGNHITILVEGDESLYMDIKAALHKIECDRSDIQISHTISVMTPFNPVKVLEQDTAG